MQSEDDIRNNSHGAAFSTTPATKRRTLFVTDRLVAGQVLSGGGGRDGASATGCGGASFSPSICGVIVGLLCRHSGALGTFIDEVQAPRGIIYIIYKEPPECARRSGEVHKVVFSPES